VPGEDILRSLRQFKNDLSLEELMIEVLIEENYFKRYTPNSLASVSIMPTSEDMWKDAQLEVSSVT